MNKKVVAKIGNTMAPGTPVVFLCDVSLKTEKNRQFVIAKIGTTGKVNAVNPDGTLAVDVDRRLSTKRNFVPSITADKLAPTQAAVSIQEEARAEGGSAWKGYTYDQLKAIATANNLTWRETSTERINVMWVIDALKKAGVQPPTAQDAGQAV